MTLPGAGEEPSTDYTNVRIEYSIDNMVSWTDVTASTPNDGIDLSRAVLSASEEAELIRPWMEKLKNGEEGNYFFAIKRLYEKQLGRKVRDTVIYRMLGRYVKGN